MSDPVSKIEDVEDVLSSIRRLVADTSGGTPREAGESDEKLDAAPQEALILTSAQRVNFDVDRDAGPTSSLEALRKAVAVADATSEKVVAGSWARSNPDEYYEDEAETTRGGWAEAQEPFVGASDRPAFAPVVQEAGASEDDEATDDEATIEQRIAEDVDAEAEDLSDAELSSDDSPQIVAAAPVPEKEVAPSLVEELGVATFLRATSEPTDPSDEGIEDASFVDIDFDDGDLSDEEPIENMLPDGADVDVGMIDEDTLRALVSEIVRTELGGELGERITRNVRKLVRREIHRALMAREFE